MRTQPFLLTTAAALAVLPAAYAQMPNASQQVETIDQCRQLGETGQSMLATNVPALYESETSDVGPQSVVQLKPRRTWVQAFGDEQYLYTDNMFLGDHFKQDADVLVSTIQAAIAPTPYEFQDGLLAPQVGYQHQWFNYDLAGSGTVFVQNFNNGRLQNVGLDTFDFNVSTVFGEISWRRQNWLFTLGADFRQLLDSGSYSEFYREYVPRWAIRRDFPLTAATGVSIGYDGDFRVTETAGTIPSGFGKDYNDRTDHSLDIVGSWRLCSHAILQPFYRFEYTHYTRINRDDFLQSFGLTLYCPVTKNVTLRGFVGYDDMNTDGVFAKTYEALNAGGGLTLSVCF